MTDGARVVDTRGLRCPWPLVRLARAMREGPAVRFLVDDRQAIADLPALARENGWSATPGAKAGLFLIAAIDRMTTNPGRFG